MNAVAPLLRPHELAGSRLLELDSDGLPMAPLLLVDLSAPVPPDAVEVARVTSRVLLGIAPGGVPDHARQLSEALTCTLVTGGASARCEVDVDDLERALSTLTRRVAETPRAASVLVSLLRLTSVLPVRQALETESLAYSLLLGGPEFGRWRLSRPRRDVPAEAGPVVRVERAGRQLRLVLDRPARHNAFNREMRDALVEALRLAVADPDLQVGISGTGPSFCSGGDLDEFGTAQDLVRAHLIRTERSAGLLLHLLRDRTDVLLHGACIGAGLELPAFAGRVRSRRDASLQLPELAMGLVPGAGGTVSVLRRIGRWRTAHLVLTGEPIDAATALAWGLVDTVED
ncbi:MAG: hypothetical protein JWL79_3152 [Frankiales bacterium]|nr:hypothetical protein [Frankiales bacterium]